MPDEVINQMLEAGLIEIAKLSVHQAQRLYRQLEILHYTRLETATQPDANLQWLREYRRN